MLPTVHIMMFGWPIVSLLLFFCCRPRNAVLISLLSGWLLLPQFSFLLPGIPNYTRSAAVVLGILLGVIIFDPGQLAHIRLRFFDIPIIALCMCPMASSLSNGLGIYDGISAVYTNTINYGIPYIIGRTYFSEPKSMREFAKGLVIAVLCYTPLILYEYRMSPQLHKIIYGFMQTHFHMVLRLGWYRPMVFLRHGLELGTLVSGATLTAFWLRRTRSVARYGWLSAGSAALFLFVILLLCRALNGYGTFIIGIIVLFAISILKIRTVALLLVLLPMIYIQGRIVMDWDAAPLIEAAESINVSRARSLESRICHESALIDKALRRPYFGWGGWDRNRVNRDTGCPGKQNSVTDSLWIIVFGQNGFLGLLSLYIVLLWPILLLIKRLPTVEWSRPVNGPAAALSVVLLGFTIDSMANAMISPIYFVIAGALISYQHIQDFAQKDSSVITFTAEVNRKG